MDFDYFVWGFWKIREASTNLKTLWKGKYERRIRRIWDKDLENERDLKRKYEKKQK